MRSSSRRGQAGGGAGVGQGGTARQGTSLPQSLLGYGLRSPLRSKKAISPGKSCSGIFIEPRCGVAFHNHSTARPAQMMAMRICALTLTGTGQPARYEVLAAYLYVACGCCHPPLTACQVRGILHESVVRTLSAVRAERVSDFDTTWRRREKIRQPVVVPSHSRVAAGRPRVTSRATTAPPRSARARDPISSSPVVVGQGCETPHAHVLQKNVNRDSNAIRHGMKGDFCPIVRSSNHDGGSSQANAT